MKDELRLSALEYHRAPTAGKIAVIPTKPLANQRDLSLAYSPGVAAACEAISANPHEARTLTARGNLVAVITNGTAVLGLGAIGPLAAKPVMEGKGVLFKQFAGVDVFDIEINERDPDRLVEIIAALEPTFGGINLEDIKAPECFEIERKLRERLKIPVFHDDQHGTSIIVGAAVRNGLRVVGKDIRAVKLVASGAGAAALACLDMLVAMGLPMENITVTDIAGVVYAGRKQEMDPNKARYARATRARTLDEVIEGADIFLGLSAGGVLKPDMVKRMAARPIILALANPDPEIMPEDARAVRADAIIATGRSDYNNQVNNVLCFPFIFRGALDVGATTINEAMKLACVHAIADLALEEQPDFAAMGYGEQVQGFGPDYLIPKPFDPRLITRIAPAVAKAAMQSGVATRPLADFDLYRERLNQFVYHSGLVMKPVLARAKAAPRRLVYAEGEEPKVLRTAQAVLDDGIAIPVLIGRPDVVQHRIERLGLRMRPGADFELINPDSDPRYREYWMLYHSIMQRRGVTPEAARREVRRHTTLIGALMLHRSEAEAMICGLAGRHSEHLKMVLDVLGLRAGASNAATMNMLLHPKGIFFVCDTYVNYDPDPEQIAEMTVLAAEKVLQFGITPKVALLSHSSFGSADSTSALKMRRALELIRARAPELEVEGEMHGDAAMAEEIRLEAFPNSRLKGRANLLIMPNLDAANISFNLLKVLGDNITIGPILLGVARAVHVLTPTATVRRMINMSALAVVDAEPRVATHKN